MKRLLFVLVTLAAIVLVGCENGASTQATKNAITGHSFRAYGNDANWDLVSFAVDGTVVNRICTQGTEATVEHLTYTVHGGDIEVFRDHSDAWLPSHRGALFKVLFFLPEYDCLKSDGGMIYYRWTENAQP